MLGTTGSCLYHHYPCLNSPSLLNHPPYAHQCTWPATHLACLERSSYSSLPQNRFMPKNWQTTEPAIRRKGGRWLDLGPYTPVVISWVGNYDLSHHYSVNHLGILGLICFFPFIFQFFFIICFASCLKIRNLKGMFIVYGFVCRCVCVAEK